MPVAFAALKAIAREKEPRAPVHWWMRWIHARAIDRISSSVIYPAVNRYGKRDAGM
jgi:hypothetical protein